MSLLLLSLSVLGFVLFFYGIGLRYLALIPLIFLGLFFWYYGGGKIAKVKWSEVIQKYSLYVAWIIILAGLVGILNYFGMDLTNISLWLLTLNLVLRVGSHMTNYRDGKSVFQIWFYFCVALLLIISLALGGWLAFYNVFCMLRVMHLWITAFFIFLVGLHQPVEKYMWYKLGVLSLGTVFLVVFDQIKNMDSFKVPIVSPIICLIRKLWD